MEIVCPHCRQSLQFAEKKPAFCAYCGKPLSSAADPTVGADTASEDAAARDAAARDAAARDAAAGNGDDPAEVGGYRLVRVLGEGGMGRVYEAEEITSGRRVALKLIAARYVESPAAVERFRREGRLASGVAHPRCVFVYAADEAGGRPYIVMELMPGTTLQDLVNRSGPLSVDEAIARILDIIDGLRELHRLGIVHRDVKPSNCLVDAQGRAKIGDFGLSRSLIRADAVTRTGTFIGTPLFAAPEQIKGEAVGARSDVYSVAATLYYLLTGRAPFQGGDPAAILARIVSDPAPPMRSLRPDLPAALDQVVLRGLERDPARRWRDLDELEAALLVFVPGRLSIGTLGFRFAAFAIDYGLLYCIGLALGLLILAVTGGSVFDAHPPPGRVLVQFAAGILVWLLYFGGCEAIWSCTPGKRWLRLRVASANVGQRPRIAAVVLRTALCYVLLNLGILASSMLMAAGLGQPTDDPEQQILESLLLVGTIYPLEAVGIILLLCTMRARNGYRGLHEMLSGTRVVRLPDAADRRALLGQDQEPVTVVPEDLPARIGPFDMVGVLAQDGPRRVLLGLDSSLGRRVWIWQRPAQDPLLSAARRDVGRAARLRWLAGGRDGPSQWDAFLAPAGGPLRAERSAVHLTWGATRLLLAQLAEELIAAQADGTLPPALNVGHVWLRSDGRVTLLDVAVGPASAQTDSQDGVTPLPLLAQTALLALGATPRSAHGRPYAVGAPLPRYASAIIGRLIGIGAPFADVEEFHAALAAAADKPPTVTRSRRLAHLALLAAFSSVVLCCGLGPAAFMPSMSTMIVVFEIERKEQLGARLAEVAERDREAARAPDPARRQAALAKMQENTRLGTALDEAITQARQEQQARSDAMSWAARTYSEAVQKQVAETKNKQKLDPMALLPPVSEPDQVRRAVEFAIANHGHSREMALGMAFGQTIFPAVWLVIWVLWALLTRGGLSFMITGLALARHDGRPTLRLQCAWRALLIWVPVSALLIVSIWLETWYWSIWPAHRAFDWLLTASFVAWWVSLALLPLYALLALWFPRRSLHDWLAGTYVVPR
jgi:uncharacterized RDD family membrane protein YckC